MRLYIVLDSGYCHIVICRIQLVPRPYPSNILSPPLDSGFNLEYLEPIRCLLTILRYDWITDYVWMIVHVCRGSGCGGWYVLADTLERFEY